MHGLILAAKYPLVEKPDQPASLDLRLGDTAYCVRAKSVVFSRARGSTVAESIETN